MSISDKTLLPALRESFYFFLSNIIYKLVQKSEPL